MININPNLSEHLRKLQMFAPNELAAFHYVHHEDIEPSWIYLQLVSLTTIKNTELERKKAYLTIIKQFWGDQKWRRLAETALNHRAVPYTGTQEEKIIKFLQTFNVTFREGVARQSKPSNFYLVTGEPASHNEQLNEKLTTHMKTMTFQTGFHQLLSPTRNFSCHICKMEDHQHTPATS